MARRSRDERLFAHLQVAVASIAFCLLHAACRATPPDGTFACQDSLDCPPEQSCNAGLCYLHAPVGVGESGATSGSQPNSEPPPTAAAPASKAADGPPPKQGSDAADGAEGAAG